jgi:hypothetical protein
LKIGTFIGADPLTVGSHHTNRRPNVGEKNMKESPIKNSDVFTSLPPSRIKMSRRSKIQIVIGDVVMKLHSKKKESLNLYGAFVWC